MSDTTVIVTYKKPNDDDNERFEGVTDASMVEGFFQIGMGEFTTLIPTKSIREINIGPTEFMD